MKGIEEYGTQYVVDYNFNFALNCEKQAIKSISKNRPDFFPLFFKAKLF